MLNLGVVALLDVNHFDGKAVNKLLGVLVSCSDGTFLYNPWETFGTLCLSEIRINLIFSTAP